MLGRSLPITRVNPNFVHWQLYHTTLAAEGQRIFVYLYPRTLHHSVLKGKEMTKERKQELRQLLQEAMESIVITRNSMATMLVLQGKSMSIEEYRECLQTRRRSYRPDLIVTDLAYRPEIQDDVIKSKLLNFIRAELKNYIREHKHKLVRVFGYAETIQTAVYGIHGGGTPMGFPIESLLEKFLKIVIASGAETAISAFDKCTKETKGFFQKIIFIRGIGISEMESLLEKIEQTEEVKISQGIRLIHSSDLPLRVAPIFI